MNHLGVVAANLLRGDDNFAFGFLLLEGDAQETSEDALQLEGDASDGDDLLIIREPL